MADVVLVMVGPILSFVQSCKKATYCSTFLKDSVRWPPQTVRWPLQTVRWPLQTVRSS
jgi:hypothetical protein